MRVALVTCEELPAWEIDDHPLIAALARSADVRLVPWTSDVDWGGFDVALLRTPWDYADQVDAFLAWAERAAAATRLLHGPAILRWNLRKTYLRALAGAGVSIAPTAWIDAPQALRAAFRDLGADRAFLKPVVGASARLTFRFHASQLDDAVAFVASAREPMMLQPYLPSVEDEGELSAIVIAGEITHAVRKVPVTGDYRVQDDWGGSDMAIDCADDLRALTHATLAAAQTILGERLLYARVDALRTPDGALVLNELEIVEPSLFFRHGRHAASKLAEAAIASARSPHAALGDPAQLRR